MLLMNALGLAMEIIKQQVLPQGVRGGEVGLAATNLADLMDEVHQAVVIGEHKSVDQDAGAAAAGNFLECLADHQRVEPEGVFVNASVFERQRRRLAVRDHHDLAHILVLEGQEAARQP